MSDITARIDRQLMIAVEAYRNSLAKQLNKNKNEISLRLASELLGLELRGKKPVLRIKKRGMVIIG